MMGSTSATALPDEAAQARAASATSWGAIFAGAAAAIGLTLILMMLGAGLGLASAPGLSAVALTAGGTIWLIVTQWLSAAVGGYLTGRLRVRWLSTHGHEVYFRDTAHGLVTWAIASIVMAAFLGNSALSAMGGAARAGGHEMMHPMRVPAGADTDRLFRSADPSATDARAEAERILAGIAGGAALADEDRNYLAAVVTAKSGVSRDEAQKRVEAVVQRVQANADSARKAAARTAIYTALSLLIGAFIASVAAALGGHLRDEHT